MTAKDLVGWYYQTLREKHYKPIESWGRDGKAAKRFLDSGRTDEEFKTLVGRGLVGPKEIQTATVSGIHTFLYRLPEIELLGAAPWEPSIEERQANIKILEATHAAIVQAIESRAPKKQSWIKDEKNGGWKKL